MTATDTSAAPLPDDFFVEHPPERRALIERMRLLNLGLLLSLIALGLSWELWLAPLKGGSGGMLALKVLPLTLGVAGMLRHRMYTYRWMTLLIWLYFTEGVVRASVEAGLSQYLAFAEVALSTGLFTACSVYVRLRLRVLPPKPKKDKTAKQTPNNSGQAGGA